MNFNYFNLKSHVPAEWLKNLLAFLALIAGYGFALNLIFFGLRLVDFFDISSVAGFGLAYYFITEEFLVWFRPRKPPAPPAERTRGEKIAETRMEGKKIDREGALQKLKRKIDALKFTEGKKS